MAENKLVKLLDIPKITDPRGNLAVIEKDVVPFEIKRVYYLYDVPAGAARGGHSHREQKEFLVALSGSFDVILDDASTKEKVTLNRPDKGLFIDANTWRELENFSSGAVCLVVASDVFVEEDYVRSYEEYIASKS